MASQLSSAGFIRGCSGVSAFGMTPVAITPAAHNISGEGKTMHVTTKRTLVAAAALTAAGLFGSLPYHGSAQAQGVPNVHHDVALVDVTSPIVTSEIALDDSLYSGLYGSTTGLYAELYDKTVSALGATTADTLLGTTAIGGADGIFDGAANSFSRRSLPRHLGCRRRAEPAAGRDGDRLGNGDPGRHWYRSCSAGR